jgi:tetratricopeptide (TPR) repeat protein
MIEVEPEVMTTDSTQEASSFELSSPFRVLEQVNQEVAELSKRGYQLLKENKCSEAIDLFTKILALEADNNYALVGLGDAARKEGRYKDAVEYYKRCLSYHPGNNYACFGLADCYKALNMYTQAIKIWEQYLTHDSKNITVLTRVADAYRKTKDFKKSREVYLKVLDMESDNHYALIGLGHLHYDFKEYRDAMTYWKQVYELCGEQDVDIRVLTSIGNCHRKLKTYQEGIPWFEKALEREPNNFYALFGMADCYRGLAMHDKSLEYWQQILRKDPQNKVILTRAGDDCRLLGNYQEADDYYRKALNIEFDSFAVLGLAETAKAQGKYSEAIVSLKRLVQQDPNDYRYSLELALCFERNNQRQEAIDILTACQRQGIHNSLISRELDNLRTHGKTAARNEF